MDIWSRGGALELEQEAGLIYHQDEVPELRMSLPELKSLRNRVIKEHRAAKRETATLSSGGSVNAEVKAIPGKKGLTGLMFVVTPKRKQHSE